MKSKSNAIALNPNNKGFHVAFASNESGVFFGFGNNTFKSPVTGCRSKFSCYGDEDFRIQDVGNSTPVTRREFLNSLQDEENPFFKKYVWDSEDLKTIDIEELRVTDFLRVQDDFFLVTGITQEHIEIISMHGIKFHANINSLDAFRAFRAITL